MTNYPVVSVGANFFRSPPKRSVGFLCELPLAEAAEAAYLTVKEDTKTFTDKEGKSGKLSQPINDNHQGSVTFPPNPRAS
jgi:hypothetical protein